ncbi:TetR family transcriptional regulator [Streptomyces sp. NRRL B-1677]|uniref:TetR/AcrR family transcriptional regulator n=1 Tax=Streptomyces sp. NRRL B-1677 TaxID=2682966 RepID=UPI001892C81C|nr:TetR/AcrR family transcriptional regulator [Streptomyces sp. NRRL B-1677]MBF6048626.1 TetR family transcriptional regulator [Streptomyces sp. NRRL B-1677]
MEASPGSTKQAAAAKDPSRRTFTEAARRAQIVNAAIEVIADAGYAKASFARIARAAGLSSTGMISYHFAGKDDLMREVVAEVSRVADAHVRPRMEERTGARARLRAFIEASVGLADAYPKHVPAMVDVLAHLRDDDPSRRDVLGTLESAADVQIERMREAQRSGEFREFDPRVMATAIRAAVDATVTRAGREPDFDAEAAGRELADLFDHATRRTER